LVLVEDWYRVFVPNRGDFETLREDIAQNRIKTANIDDIEMTAFTGMGCAE
jgi:hypothetical protein